MELSERALAPDKLTKIEPRHFLLDLDEETPGIACEEVLKPDFWADATDTLHFGDFVTAISKTFTIELFIGVPHEDGGFYVTPVSALVEPCARSEGVVQ